MIEHLQQKIRQLKINIQMEHNINNKITLQKEMYKTKIELLDLIHEKDKTRAGITARELIRRVKSMPTLPRFEVGISKIDNRLNGFMTGILVQLAGESGAGKTSLLLKIVSNIATNKKSVFFNFEMGDRLFVKKLQQLSLNDNQLDNLIIDSDTNRLEDLLMEIELYAEDGVKFFAIDSKMKIHSSMQGQELSLIHI